MYETKGKVTRRDEKALPGAYAIGQTDLDGGMVVRATSKFVRKERAPWMR